MFPLWPCQHDPGTKSFINSYCTNAQFESHRTVNGTYFHAWAIWFIRFDLVPLLFINYIIPRCVHVFYARIIVWENLHTEHHYKKRVRLSRVQYRYYCANEKKNVIKTFCTSFSKNLNFVHNNFVWRNIFGIEYIQSIHDYNMYIGSLYRIYQINKLYK